MSLQPNKARPVAPEIATVYLSMADLARTPGGAAEEPVDLLKTCIGLGPDDPIVMPKRERIQRVDVASAVPVVRHRSELDPVQRWFQRYVEPVASAAKRLRLESRVLMVCWRLRAAARYSRSTLAGARRWWALGVAGALVMGLLGMARMGESAVVAAIAPAAIAEAVEVVAEVEGVAAVEVVGAGVARGAVEVVGAGDAELAAALPARTTLARAAADATAGAQYAIALDFYRRLLRSEPGNPAYANMIVALERRVRGTSPAD